MNDNYYTHLSLNDRVVIQTGCENVSSKKSIADTIGKDPTTVAKEIKRNAVDKKQECLDILIMSVCIERTVRRKTYVELNAQENQYSPVSFTVAVIQATRILRKKSVQV